MLMANSLTSGGLQVFVHQRLVLCLAQTWMFDPDLDSCFGICFRFMVQKPNTMLIFDVQKLVNLHLSNCYHQHKPTKTKTLTPSSRSGSETFPKTEQKQEHKIKLMYDDTHWIFTSTWTKFDQKFRFENSDNIRFCLPLKKFLFCCSSLCLLGIPWHHQFVKKIACCFHEHLFYCCSCCFHKHIFCCCSCYFHWHLFCCCSCCFHKHIFGCCSCCFHQHLFCCLLLPVTPVLLFVASTHTFSAACCFHSHLFCCLLLPLTTVLLFVASTHTCSAVCCFHSQLFCCLLLPLTSVLLLIVNLAPPLFFPAKWFKCSNCSHCINSDPSHRTSIGNRHSDILTEDHSSAATAHASLWFAEHWTNICDTAIIWAKKEYMCRSCFGTLKSRSALKYHEQHKVCQA